MLTHLEFRSHQFPPMPGEDEQVNPGVYGRRLAEFLHRHLRSEGFETEDPFAEDWGWTIPVVNKDFPLWIGCANYEYEDGFLCFIEPHKSTIRRFLRKIDTRERVHALQQAIDRVRNEDAGIREKKWWTHVEFVNPARPNPAGE